MSSIPVPGGVLLSTPSSNVADLKPVRGVGTNRHVVFYKRLIKLFGSYNRYMRVGIDLRRIRKKGVMLNPERMVTFFSINSIIYVTTYFYPPNFLTKALASFKGIPIV